MPLKIVSRTPDYAKVPLIEPTPLGADLLPARLGFVA